MKDITDYFKTSTENFDASLSETPNENIVASAKSNKKNKIVDLLCSKSNENSDQKTTNKRRTSIKQVPSENVEKKTANKSITEFDAPESGKTRKQSNIEIESIEKNKIIDVIDSDPDNTDRKITTGEMTQIETPSHSAVNAFQFLMNSRNKVIGTNSPGKELAEKEDNSSDVFNKKLAVRKKLLQSWADSKKNNKRKLNDEEIDETIKVKLETRKKRLKRLLHVGSIDAEYSLGTQVKSTSITSKRQSALSNFGVTSLNSSLRNVNLITENKQKNYLESANEINESVINLFVKTENNSSKTKDSKRLKKPLSCSEEEFEETGYEDSNDSLSIKTNKHKHKHKKKKIDCTPVNKSVSMAKPLRHWKMKIKLCDRSQILSSAGNSIEKDLSEQLIRKNIDIRDEEVTILNDHDICEKKNKSKVILGSVEVNDCQRGNYLKKRTSDKNEITGDIKNPESKAEVILPENNEFRRVLRNRVSLQNQKMDQFEELSSSDSTDESFEAKKKGKKTLRVAPVFTKSIPKPKVDPEIIQAKKDFLMSEMPDILKKPFKKQESLIVPEFDVFPKISHIYQINPEESFFNLPYIQLPMRSDDISKYNHENLLCQSLVNYSKIEISRYNKSEPIKNVKTIIRNMKLENTNYPVYKAYRLLKERNSADQNKFIEKNRSNRLSKAKKFTEKMENESVSTSKHLMWTEKYKPSSAEDMIGNFQAVSTLKKWLESWHEAFESGRKKYKTIIYSSDSESDFILSDVESVNGGSSLTTTVILTGPSGSGKSSSVYGICNELGLNVIELNASSRRTGKQVLQELQEATQSHQVRKDKESILSFTKKKKNSKTESRREKNNLKKMCVLLIEDVDIVFEQDEGFINAISQISSITKRPIILTTSNENSIHSQKFMNDFKSIKFNYLTAINVGVWLQVLCLLEGNYTDISSIGELLEYNNGDVRKTLLELQFWIQSGGQISKHKSFVDSIFQMPSLKEDDDEVCLMQTDDNASIVSLKEQEGIVDNFRTHSNVISDFEIFQLDRFYDVPENFDLVKIWWNIPTFLNIASMHRNSFNPKKKSKRVQRKLKIISNMFDSFVLCDVSYRKVSFKCDAPVCPKRWKTYLQDSLEIGEVLEEYSSNRDLLFEWNHYLVNGCVNRCKEKFVQPASESQRLLNMATPRLECRSKLEKCHRCEEELLAPVPLLCYLDRKSVSLDYLPVLRNIARSEKNRAQNNVKRHNRFHNYLQNLNIKRNSLVLNFATDTLQVNR